MSETVGLKAFCEKHATTPVTFSLLHEVIEVMFDALKAAKARNEALEVKVARLESRPLQKWAGTFIRGTAYTEASLCTHKGGLWVAITATRETPGESSDWRLIVKRGQA